jgi:hypothetical protein
MKLKHIFFAAVSCLLLCPSFFTYGQDKNNCLLCHTSDKLMKSMYTPTLHTGEAEGEG